MMFLEGNTVICTHTFNHNNKAVPQGRKYTVTDNTSVPIDEDKPWVVETKATLEIVTEPDSDDVCQTLEIFIDNYWDKFKPDRR